MTDQHVTEETLDLYDDSLTEQQRRIQLVSVTRDMVNKLLEKGAAAHEVSYMFAYVATELGLYYTDGSYRVFPHVMQAVTDAGYVQIREDNEKNAATLEREGNEVLH